MDSRKNFRIRYKVTLSLVVVGTVVGIVGVVLSSWVWLTSGIVILLTAYLPNLIPPHRS